MNWGSWAEFWSMGGRGPFVWGSYAVVALAVIVEIVTIRARLARARRACAAEASRKATQPTGPRSLVADSPEEREAAAGPPRS